MADKDFIVKNGLVVNTDLIVANGSANRVGINNSSPDASLTVTGTANVSANVALGSALIVSGNTDVGGYVNVVSTANIGGDTNLRGTLTVNGATIVANTISTGNSTVTGFINVSSTANVGGAVNLRSTLAVNGATTIANILNTGNTTVTGFINVSSTANVGGATSLRGTLTVNGATVVANTIATGNSTVSGFINVSSTANVGGDTNLRGALTVNGASIIANTLSVTGNTDVSGYINVVSTANVGGATNLRGTLTVNGAVVVDNTVNISNATNITNTLGVTGLITGSGGATITGTTNTSVALNVGSNVNVTTSAINIGNSAVNAVANSTQIRVGNSTVNTVISATTIDTDGSLAVLNSVSFSNTLGVTGATTLSNTLGVTGLITGSGGATITGTTNTSVSMNVGANVNITTSRINVGNSTVNTAITATGIDTDGTLAVLNATSLSNTLAVTGAATLSNTLSVTGNTTVGGFINVASTANVGGATNLRGSLTVNGAVVIDNTVNISNATIINNTLAAGNTNITGFVNASANSTLSGDIVSVKGVRFIDSSAYTVGNTSHRPSKIWSDTVETTDLIVTGLITGTFNTDGSIIPNSNTTNDLGSAAKFFDELFVQSIVANNIGLTGGNVTVTSNNQQYKTNSSVTAVSINSNGTHTNTIVNGNNFIVQPSATFNSNVFVSNGSVTTTINNSVIQVGGGATITSTTFSGTSANATNLNDKPASFYTNATNLDTGTVPIARLPLSSTSQVGAVQLSDSVTSTSVTLSATANSVKTAYDSAIAANNRAYSAQTAADSASTKADTAYSNAVSYTNSGLALKANLSGATFSGSVLPSANAVLFGGSSARWNIFGNTINLTGVATFGSDVNINGNLVITGTTTFVNTQTLNVSDNIVTLNADVSPSTAPTENAGIEVNRGSSANVSVLWNETTDRWTLTNDGTNFTSIPTSEEASNASFLTTGTVAAARLSGTYNITANNATNLGGVAASNYARTDVANSFNGIMTFNANVVLGSSGLSANGGFGTAGQVLHSNGTATYWATDDQGVTSVATGNGLTGGTITTTGTISVVGSNTVVSNSSGVFVNSNTGLVANATGLHVNSSYIAGITVTNATNAANAVNLNGQPASYYTNASNITTGTLPYAQIPANIANTTGSFTFTNVHTHNANIILSAAALLIANGNSGSAGQVLHTSGVGVYWDTDDQGVTSVATGNGLTGGTITTTGTVSVLANTGIVANATGVYVNAAYIGTLSANNTTYLNGQLASYYTNASNMSTGTLPSGRLTGSYDISISGTAANASLLSSQPSSYYTNASNMSTGTLPTGRLSGSYTILASNATLASKASTLAMGGGTGAAMTFNFSGQSGSPIYVWGTNDGTGANTNVYQPAAFNVNSATSALNANNASYLGGVAAASYVTTSGGSVSTWSVSGNLSFNSGYGSAAVAYGCRAWVNFDSYNGVGGITIRGSGNITSITDISFGQFKLNYTNSMPDTNYAFIGNAFTMYNESTAPLVFFGNYTGTESTSTFFPATDGVKFNTGNVGGTPADADFVYVAIFR